MYAKKKNRPPAKVRKSSLYRHCQKGEAGEKRTRGPKVMRRMPAMGLPPRPSLYGVGCRSPRWFCRRRGVVCGCATEPARPALAARAYSQGSPDAHDGRLASSAHARYTRQLCIEYLLSSASVAAPDVVYARREGFSLDQQVVELTDKIRT